VPIRIIVADDNGDSRESLKLALEMEGFHVETAAHGDEAYAHQLAQPADVLITDLFMPQRDGFETLDRFRREFPNTRIIVISGDSSRVRRSYIESAELMGADASFRKPYEIPALIAAIRRLTR
jgi:DNA-binding response OmpR family regulator